MAVGYTIYDGPSMLDGQRIVVIVTGIKGSRNTKTGNMVQTYILRPDMHPLEAVRTGADVSICGDCPARGKDSGYKPVSCLTFHHQRLFSYICLTSKSTTWKKDG